MSSPTDQFLLRDHPTWRPIQKIRAAQAAIGRLDQEWRGHVDAGLIQVEEHRDQDEGAIWFVLRIPDPDAVTALESHLRICVSDGRSALSNLVHELARREGASDADLRVSDFPITSTGTNWKKVVASRLKRLPPDVVERIAAVQPWKQPLPEPRLHPLQVLSELNNADKHRDGLWIAPELGSEEEVHQVAEVRYAVPVERHEEELIRLNRPDDVAHLNPHPLADGEIVMRLHFPDWIDVKSDVTIGNLALQVHPTLMSPYASPDHYPLLRELSEALEYARTTIRYIGGIQDDPPMPQPRVPLTE